MYRKELRYYFSTPIAYIVIGLYLLAVSLLLWVIPGEWNIPQSGYAQADGLFRLSPWLFMLLCPALTMRLFTEERQTGTWMLLRTKPVSLLRITTSKMLAAWTVVVLAQLPCLVHYALVYSLAEPAGNIDSGAFFGSFLGLLFLSAVFTSIGTWASTLSRSQIVAFITGAACCFICYWGFDLLASIFSGHMQAALQWCGLNSHYASISRGVIDLRDVIFFLSESLIFVLLSVQSMKRK
ncbi:MAG: ABC transporter permease [Paludibacteraceae bacterium]|nr:ABC transporter permease [Paludibacteraceae bacterium]MBQ9706060.1 ABC transporter permease [Paludibacteraceae bacterium]